METLTKNKTTAKIVGIFILVMLAYNLFFKADKVVPVATGGTNTPSILGSDLLKMSTDLSKATLSQELFGKPTYRYLIDFSTALPSQPVGRSNPFETIGRD